jgi:hypothetical protein
MGYGGLLGLILGLREQNRQRQQMGILNQILSQAMGPKDVGMEQIAPSPGVEGMGYEPGIFYGEPKIERPKTLPQDILSTVLSDPRLSLEGKMIGFNLLGKMQPEAEAPIKLAPEEELVTPKGERIYRAGSKARETKRHVLKEGEQLVDDEGNVIAEGPEKKEKPKLVTVSPGQKIVDETGKAVFEMPEKEAEAPKTREYKKNGELITEEWDAQAKKWKPVAKAPREIAKPGEISTEKKKQIDIWTSAINTTLKKYAPIGEGLLISVGEGFDWSSARNAYEKLKEKADKGDLMAKKDLRQIDNWIEKISKEAGLPQKAANDPLGLRR